MPTGQTRDAGWQVGVSRTIDASPQAVWEVLVSAQGLAVWLGPDAQLPDEAGGRWTTADAQGEVRSYRDRDRVRLRLPTHDGAAETTGQVAVVATDDGRTRLLLHEEHLRDPGERLRRQTHWRGVADRLERLIPV